MSDIGIYNAAQICFVIAVTVTKRSHKIIHTQRHGAAKQGINTQEVIAFSEK